MSENQQRVSQSDDAERREQCVPMQTMGPRGTRSKVDLCGNRVVKERWWGCAALDPLYFVLGALALMLSVVGCGRGGDGPARYDLTGAIAYDGKPVPTGSIIFAPDRSKGNDGPGASAEIKDGVYRTRAGQGTVGGAHVATVSGYDGVPFQSGPMTNPMGKPLFQSMQISVDLPKQAATHDIVIPAQKAK